MSERMKDEKDTAKEVHEETEIIEEVEDDKLDKKKEKKKSEKQKLAEEIETLKLENLRLNEKSLRAIADAENFKKRMLTERDNEKKYSNQYLIEELLPALDQLKLIVNLEVEDPNLKNYLIGFKMISDQIFNILEKDGLKQIITKDQKFDPKYHYATEKQSDKSKEEHIILATTQTGYMYKERIIRPAMVIVNEWSDENGNNK